MGDAFVAIGVWPPDVTTGVGVDTFVVGDALGAVAVAVLFDGETVETGVAVGIEVAVALAVAVAGIDEELFQPASTSMPRAMGPGS